MLRPRGSLAAWGYANSDFPDHPKACELTSHFSDVLLGPYWSERTRLVENKYAGGCRQAGVVCGFRTVW